MDAHNCYPYFEWWGDRIDRALSAGTPLAIEQDLAWHTDPKTGRSWSVVTHGEPTYGNEPTMEEYFFDRVRPTWRRRCGRATMEIGRSLRSISISKTTSRNTWRLCCRCCTSTSHGLRLR